MTNHTPGGHAEHAAAAFGAEMDFLSDPDVAGLGRSLAAILSGATENPAAVRQALLRYTMRLAEIPLVAVSGWMGTVATLPMPPGPGDHREIGPARPDSPALGALRMYHEAFAEFVDQLVTAAGLEPGQQAKARLLTGLTMEALAPANFVAANPAHGARPEAGA